MMKPEILYTCRADRQGPISTIHREIGKRIPGYRFTTFGNQTVEGINKTIIIPESITARNLPQLLQTYGTEYTIVHTGPRKRDYLVWLSALRGAKHVHTLHAAPNEPKVIKRLSILAAHADYVTAVSEFVKQWALDTLDIDKPITVIPNGVDLNNFEPVDYPSEQTFVFVGRLVKRKHPEQVLRLAQKRSDATFKIRGSGPLDDRIARMARSLPNVEFVPKLSYQELADLYADATATLCPYEREGFGMVVIESMASGTPVIGLNHGNLPSLIDEGQNGLLCDSLDLDEWLMALESIQADRGEFIPRKSVKRYSWEVIATLYRNLYDNIADSR